MLATVAAVAAETDGWRDLSGQTDPQRRIRAGRRRIPVRRQRLAEHRRQGGPGGRQCRSQRQPGALLRTHRPGQLYAGQPFAAAEGGSTYRFGGTVRIEAIKGGYAGIVVELYDADGRWLRNVECPTSADKVCGWTPMEYTVTVAPQEKQCTFVIHLMMPARRNRKGLVRPRVRGGAGAALEAASGLSDPQPDRCGRRRTAFLLALQREFSTAGGRDAVAGTDA